MTGPLQRTPIRPFPWCVRPLVSPGALRGLLGRRGLRALDDGGVARALAAARRDDVSLAACAPDDPRLDAVWSRAAAGVAVGAVRDRAFAAWRYGTRPDAGYRLVVAERGGGAAGWLAYRGLVQRGIPAGFVVDLVVAPGEDAAARALVRGAREMARAQGALLLSALLPAAGPARRALRRAGMLRVPEVLHPQLIRFSVRGLVADAPSELLRADAWSLAWSDTDVV
jgi:hypothetical protein